MKQRAAIVTGAGDGLGKGIAAALLQNGYRVAGFDNRREVVEACAREFGTDAFLPCAVNVLDEDSVNRGGSNGSRPRSGRSTCW